MKIKVGSDTWYLNKFNFEESKSSLKSLEQFVITILAHVEKKKSSNYVSFILLWIILMNGVGNNKQTFIGKNFFSEEENHQSSVSGTKWIDIKLSLQPFNTWHSAKQNPDGQYVCSARSFTISYLLLTQEMCMGYHGIKIS